MKLMLWRGPNGNFVRGQEKGPKFKIDRPQRNNVPKHMPKIRDRKCTQATNLFQSKELLKVFNATQYHKFFYSTLLKLF